MVNDRGVHQGRNVWAHYVLRVRLSGGIPVLTFIYGTRPEALKLWPVVREAAKRKVAFRTICTGQHTDLLIGAKLRADLNLNVEGREDPLEYVTEAGVALQAVLKPERNIVVVQGDTASAYAGALAAHNIGLPVAHVEAGLRSHDLTDPWPEEQFRVEIDRLSRFRFCPTPGNWQNLDAEGIATECVPPHPGDPISRVTGNTITDALRLMLVKREMPKNYVLVTLHRRESFGEPLKNILRGLAAFAKSHPDTAVLWPLHPNPHVREALQAVPMPVNVLMRGPLPYSGFLQILASANCVLTDSGGVVEEATTLGVPIVCARNKTERPEAFELSSSRRLVGTDATAVEGGLRLVFWAESEPSSVFGDGYAAKRILDVLV